MRTIPHREMRNSSGEVLRNIEAGESFEITNNGRVVALMVPPSSDPLRSTSFRRPLHREPFSTIQRTESSLSVQAALDALRDER